MRRTAEAALGVGVLALIVALVWPEKFREKFWGIEHHDAEPPTSTRIAPPATPPSMLEPVREASRPATAPTQTTGATDPARMQRFARLLAEAAEPPPRPVP